MTDGRRDSDTRWGRLRLVLFPALLGPAQLFLFGPFTTYSRNESEFVVGFWELATLWLWAFPLVAAVLVAIGMWMPRRWLQRYIVILFAIGILLWAQGNLLVPDFGPLYGTTLDFERSAWRTPLELALWAAALVLAVVFARSVFTAAPLASQVLLALQLVVLVVSASGLMQTAGDDDDEPRSARRWRQPPAGIYALSTSTNIIHLVLDGFPSEIFAEAMSRDRAAFDRVFSGFVFFPDHLAAFRSTRASMPAMFSGVAYRNEVPFNQFRAGLAKRPSIFTVLARRGYKIQSITFHPGEHPPQSIRRGVDRYRIPTPYGDRETYVRSAGAQVLDLTLFRHAPNAFKPWIYNDESWLIQRWTGSVARQVRQSNHLVFFDEFTGRMTPASARPLYLYMHIIPPHPPIVLDSSCAFIGRRPVSRTAFAGQAECVLAHVRRFLDRLRALGLYDRSVILLMADHGWILNRPDHPLKGISTPAGRLDRVASDAMPLLLIKPAGASGPLRTSHAPTALTDVPATIAAIAGAPTQSLPGQSVFEIDPAAPRRRTFTFHSWANADWKRPYFDALLEFEVNGRVLDREAWTFKQAILDPTSDVDTAIEDLEIGLSEVRDDGDGPVRWGQPYAVTYVPPDARTLTVTARQVSVTKSHRTITVRVDGRVLGRLELTGSGWHTSTFPLEPREGAQSPFCVEFIAEQPADGPGEPPTRVQYRAPFWTR